MQGRRGIAWLLLALGLAGLVCTPLSVQAADSASWRIASGWRLPILPVAAQTPMEAQMLGEKPFQAQPPRPETPLLPSTPGLSLDSEGGATIRLPHNLEMRISVLYSREPSLEPQRRPESSSLLLKYAMEYRLLPNLQVGLSGYLYRPDGGEGFSFGRAFGDRVMGVGPGLKYDLGRWSFVIRSQFEPGSRDRGDNLQNWFRVWYAF